MGMSLRFISGFGKTGGLFEAGRGMAGAVDLLELLDADLGVDLGGGQFGVAEELLDEADVGSVFEHEGGTGVPQQVAGAAFAECGGVDVVADELGQPVRRERLEQVRQEQGAVIGFAGIHRPDLVAVSGDPRKGAVADGHDAVLPALALADEEGAALGIDVVGLEAHQLAAPHAGAVKGFHGGRGGAGSAPILAW